MWLSRWGDPFEFSQHLWQQKTSVCDKRTDEQTDKHNDDGRYHASIASRGKMT